MICQFCLGSQNPRLMIKSKLWSVFSLNSSMLRVMVGWLNWLLNFKVNDISVFDVQVDWSYLWWDWENVLLILKSKVKVMCMPLWGCLGKNQLCFALIHRAFHYVSMIWFWFKRFLSSQDREFFLSVPPAESPEVPLLLRVHTPVHGAVPCGRGRGPVGHQRFPHTHHQGVQRGTEEGRYVQISPIHSYVPSGGGRGPVGHQRFPHTHHQGVQRGTEEGRYVKISSPVFYCSGRRGLWGSL